jgi:nicotinamidase/pyrazinamidase
MPTNGPSAVAFSTLSTPQGSDVVRRLQQKIRTINQMRQQQQQNLPSLPPNWISTPDKRTKRPVYYNTVTGESTWVRPTNGGEHGSGRGDDGDDDSDNSDGTFDGGDGNASGDVRRRPQHAPPPPQQQQQQQQQQQAPQQVRPSLLHRQLKRKHRKAALLVVNVQKDFFAKGAMPVPSAERVLLPIHTLCQQEDMVVVHVRLQRPANHASFFCNNPGSIFLDRAPGVEQEMYVVPSHCVEGTPGADIHDLLRRREDTVAVVDVGGSPLLDDYSPFAAVHGSVPLEDLLRAHGVAKVFVVGIGLETAVQAVALDAQLYCDGDVHVVIDAVAELGSKWTSPAVAEQVQKRLQGANIGIIDLQQARDLTRGLNRRKAPLPAPTSSRPSTSRTYGSSSNSNSTPGRASTPPRGGSSSSSSNGASRNATTTPHHTPVRSATPPRSNSARGGGGGRASSAKGGQQQQQQPQPAWRGAGSSAPTTRSASPGPREGGSNSKDKDKGDFDWRNLPDDAMRMIATQLDPKTGMSKTHDAIAGFNMRALQTTRLLVDVCWMRLRVLWWLCP